MDRADAFKLIWRLFVDAKENGGGTRYGYNGEPYEGSGFVVGGRIPSYIYKPVDIEGPDQGSLIGAVDWAYVNQSAPFLFGSWVSDGLVYFDSVDILDNEFDAVVLGKERGEKAIWDGAAGREIVLADCSLGDGYAEVEG